MEDVKDIFVNGRFDYTLSIKKIKEDKTVYSLFYSLSEEWTNPGKLIMSLTDNGNGLKLSKLRKASRMDYDEALEVSILLKVYHLLDDYKVEMVENRIEL